ncbi:hypothetical protein [Natronomonas gomsonensis]|uniref:RAD55 family ATPase n=1 Tax=Natronomonas gomsonensis TaxID=1046043 RepID=UPI0015B8F4D6|nr:hypothetical protein [Natronomonas gomsonensis]
MRDEYRFAELPLADIRPGTSVLVSGPTHDGARSLSMQMLAGEYDEGAIIVTTNQRASRVAEDCQRFGIDVRDDRTAILDCVGDDDDPDVPARVLPVSGPSDLTGIGMRFSDVYREFKTTDIDRVRTGLCSVSTLLSFGDLRTVSRFTHTLVGRIDKVDGLGVFVVDPAGHDEQAINTLAQFCSGRIEVRDRDGRAELRTRGLADQPREWTPFDAFP